MEQLIVHESRGWHLVRVSLTIAVLSTLAFSFFVPSQGTHHFAFLAGAFAHGSYSVNTLPSTYADKVVVGDNTFIPLAPMPGILLMPIAALLGPAFDELVFAYLFTAANILLLLALVRQLRVPARIKWTLLALFFCGTIYLSALAVGRSWFLSHIISTTFLLLAINETLSHRRSYLIGFWLGFAFLTRSPTVFSLPFFIWMLKPSDKPWFQPRRLISTVFQLSLGLAIPFLFFFDYNYSRFGNPLETGYGYAIVGSGTLANAMQQGLFNPAHLPKNLFAFLLAFPLPYPGYSAPVLTFPYVYPSPWGMGILFTTPAFVYALSADWRSRLARASLVAILLVFVPLAMYYGIGWIQFGYRYALDFYPFLFILAALGMSKDSHLARILIVISIVINIWGAWWQIFGFPRLPPSLLR